MIDPVATFHFIYNKINFPENGEDEYPGPEMAHDLACMLLCARTLINHNVELTEKWRLAENKFENEAVSILQKDMEIYELRQIISELKKASQHGKDIG